MAVTPEFLVATNLLQSFAIEPGQDVYELGCTATPQNVHSQQQRAFNLAWALHVAGRLDNDRSVAVVGGGVAGVTIASSLVGFGNQVWLYESMQDILHLQQGNLTRFLHPNIATWPHTGFGYSVTHLPFMNWRAGSAGDVEAQIRRQWKRLRTDTVLWNRLHLMLNHKITALQQQGNQWKLTYKGTKREKAKTFDIVIVAAGFGIEISTFADTPSYWRNDDLAQPVLGKKNKIRYLVSGTGDGGLTDVLRLTLRDFQHQQFVQQIMYDDSLRRLAIRMERRLHRAATEQQRELIWARFTKRKDNLGTEMESALNRLFNKRLIRADTAVTINSRRKCPFLTESQIFNRLAVAILLRKGKIKHVVGELKSLYTSSSRSELQALIEIPNGVKLFQEADFVVQRNGADPTLTSLLGPNGQAKYKELTTRSRGPNSVSQNSVLPSHPRHFLADEFMRSHYEDEYELGIVLSTDGARLAAREFLLRLNMPAQAAQCLLPNFTFPVTHPWKNGAFTFRFEQHQFRCYPQNPINQTCLVLWTTSRELLERILQQEQGYHFLRYYLTRIDFPIDRDHIDTRTGVWLLDFTAENYIEIQYWNRSTPMDSMHQAHRLLRAPTMLEIMGNKWPTTKVHGMGWAVCQTEDILRSGPAGNGLLQWDNHTAWWLAQENHL